MQTAYHEDGASALETKYRSTHPTDGTLLISGYRYCPIVEGNMGSRTSYHRTNGSEGGETSGNPDNSLQVRPAYQKEIPQLSHMLAQAFYDDPVYRWYFPDSSIRVQKCERLFQVFLEDLIPRGAVFTTEKQEGAALWKPPQVEPASWLLMAEQNIRIALIFGEGIWRGVQWWRKIERHHPNYPYWHLFLIGVAPGHQGQGIGATLLQPILERCDAEKVPIYLDTGNPQNLPFYQHRGFKIFRKAALSEQLTAFQMVRIPV